MNIVQFKVNWNENRYRSRVVSGMVQKMENILQSWKNARPVEQSGRKWGRTRDSNGLEREETRDENGFVMGKSTRELKQKTKQGETREKQIERTRGTQKRPVVEMKCWQLASGRVWLEGTAYWLLGSNDGPQPRGRLSWLCTGVDGEEVEESVRRDVCTVTGWRTRLAAIVD